MRGFVRRTARVIASVALAVGAPSRRSLAPNSAAACTGARQLKAVLTTVGMYTVVLLVRYVRSPEHAHSTRKIVTNARNRSVDRPRRRRFWINVPLSRAAAPMVHAALAHASRSPQAVLGSRCAVARSGDSAGRILRGR